ncbi:MAG: hypothetical protein ACO22R_02460, partial [Chitinophagaceae bacterium]
HTFKNRTTACHMFAKTKTPTFIDNLTIEVDDIVPSPLHVVLLSEDGTICCKTQKLISTASTSFCIEGLSELPYGVYTLQCIQGDEIVECKAVKRV